MERKAGKSSSSARVRASDVLWRPPLRRPAPGWCSRAAPGDAGGPAALLSGPRELRVVDARWREECGVLPGGGTVRSPGEHASQGVAGPITGLEASAIERAFTAKLWAPIFLVKHGAPLISREGSFAFFSGIRAARPAAGTSITSLVNGGLEAFARAMAVELGPVRVNVISPGIVDSGPFWDRLGAEGRERLFADFATKAPARRVGRHEDLAAAALFGHRHPFLTGPCSPGWRRPPHVGAR